MSGSNRVLIEATTHTDFSVQIVWTDDQGQAIPLEEPARCEVRNAATDAVVVTFDDGVTPGTAAAIEVSPGGVVQLTAPNYVTDDWTPGVYRFDIFATVSDASAPFAGDQYAKVVEGDFVIKQAVTRGTP